jgi:hypothetical protein
MTLNRCISVTLDRYVGVPALPKENGSTAAGDLPIMKSTLRRLTL